MIGLITRLALSNPLALAWALGGIALAAFGAGGWGAWTVQGWRMEAVQSRLDVFVANVTVAGVQAEAKVKETVLMDKRRKEKTDALHTNTIAALAADVIRLRDERDRARSDLLPALAPDAKRPGVIAFDRAELERAVSDFVAGAGDLVEEGDRHRVDLDAAKIWGQRLE